MSKYIKLYDAIMAMDEWFSEPITPTQILSDLPTIEVDELHNNIDNAFQMIHKALISRSLRWNDFKSVGVDADYYDWYYAENQIYAVRNRRTDTLYIVRAKSPRMAWEHYQADLSIEYCDGLCSECELEECAIRL